MTNKNIAQGTALKLQKKMPILKVTTGILVSGCRFFCGKRAPGHSMAGKWEFPGGKIENGETPEECVVREIYEELGVVSKVVKKLGTVNYCYSSFQIELHVFVVHADKGIPISHEHTEAAFRTIDEIRALEWDDCDKQFMPALVAFAHNLSNEYHQI